jgi:Flp pilus assembly CpaE family ATPase
LGADEVLTLPLDADALASAARGPAPAAPASDRAPRRAPKPRAAGGSVVAVLGSKGAPGASECAASLAALAASRWDVALVEVDALGPSLDVRLGADPEEGSVAALARAMQAGAADVGDLLRRWTVSREGWPPVVLGAPEPLRDLARPGSAAQAVRALVSAHSVVFCDLGFLVALDDPDGAATIARIHRETLATADAIVLVLGARDVQLRHGLAQLEALAVGLEVASERLRVVVNGVGGPGAGSRLEIEAALNPRLHDHGLTVDSWLPWDARAASAARRRGFPLAVARRRGTYRRALDQLLDELFLPMAPTTRTRKQRLPATAPRTATTTARATTEEVAVPWRR